MVERKKTQIIKKITTYAKKNPLTTEQKNSLRDFILENELENVSAQDTDGGFTILLKTLNYDFLEIIYNIITTNL